MLNSHNVSTMIKFVLKKFGRQEINRNFALRLRKTPCFQGVKKRK